MALQEGLDPVDPGPDRVDIPGGDPHGPTLVSIGSGSIGTFQNVGTNLLTGSGSPPNVSHLTCRSGDRIHS
ncbi:hypothetical protein GCM10009841_04320 [Microlunatus panaciterrae]